MTTHNNIVSKNDNELPADNEERDKVRKAQGNFLIGAGAGSGKTTLIVQKIIILIEAGSLDAPKLVAITYTKAAAEELKIRIEKKLKERKIELEKENKKGEKEWQNIDKAIHELHLALIGTIHSFCLYWIQYFTLLPNSKLKVDSGSKVLNSSQSKLICFKVFWNTIQNIQSQLDSQNTHNSVQKVSDEDILFYTQVQEILSNSNKEKVEKNLFQMYQNLFILNKIEPKSFFITSLELLKQKEYEVIQEHIAQFFKLIQCYTGKDEKITSLLSKRKEQLENMEAIYKSGIYNSLWEYIYSLEIESIGNSGSQKDIKDNGNTFTNLEPNEILQLLKFYMKMFLKENQTKDLLDDISDKQVLYIQSKLFPDLSPAPCIISSDVLKNEYLRYLWYSVATYFQKVFQEYKIQNKVLDYQDQLYFAHQLIVEDSTNTKILKEKIKYIFLDEYQDIDPLQAEIFQYLENNAINVIKVGDQNQAIYGFRGGAPEIIQQEEKDRDANNKSFLNVNFRTDSFVLKFINLFFSNKKIDIKTLHTLQEEHPTPNIEGYIPNYIKNYVDLVSGAKESEDSLQSGVYIHQLLCDKKNETIEKLREYEVLWMAQEIKKIVAEANKQQKRKPTIAILFASFTSSFPIYNRIFKQENLQFYAQGRHILENATIINPFILICKLLYRTDDFISLVGLLRSGLVGCTDIEITHLFRLKEGEKKIVSPNWMQDLIENIPDDFSNRGNIVQFIQKMIYFFELVYSVSLDTLVTRILESFPWFEIFTIMGEDPKDILSKINAIIELSKTIEDGSIMGGRQEVLGDYIQYLEAIVNNDQTEQEDRLFSIEQEDDSYDVCLSTIHAAKGLEYDIVFLGNLNGGLVNPQQDPGYYFTQTFSDFGANFYWKYDLKHSQDSLKNPKQAYDDSLLKEKMRLLYVALTRAKTRLYLCFTNAPPSTKKTYHNYMIETMKFKGIDLFKGESPTPINTIYYSSSTIKDVVSITDSENFNLQSNAPLVPFQEPYSFTTISFTSPTKLLQTGVDLLDDNIDEKEGDLAEQAIDSTLSLQDRNKQNNLKLWDSKYTFNANKGVDPAEIGTIIHYFFEMMDLQKPILPERSIEYMLNSFQIPIRFHSAINDLVSSTIKSYEKSLLYEIISQSKIIGKELPFSYFDASKNQILVGYIDLVIELEKEYKGFKQGIYIVDYKTNTFSEKSWNSFEAFKDNLKDKYKVPMLLYKDTMKKYFGDNKQYFMCLYHTHKAEIILYGDNN